MCIVSIGLAISDIVAATKRYSLVGMLAWQDVRQRYRRSALGPFWLTLSMGVMIACIGLVFGQIFNSSAHTFLPFLALGMIFWTFISTVVTEGCLGFIVSEPIIKQLPIPLFVHVARVLWRNILILGHNIVILPIVFLAFGKPLGWVALLCIPGIFLLVLNLTWVALVLALSCARYRDLPQMIASLLQVLFYLTPVMWMPSSLPGKFNVYLLNMNPVFHLVEIVRAPLLGDLPTLVNWFVSLSMAIVGWWFALVIYGRYKSRIAYWL
ncbi:MAG: ABC transporter permease [Azonexus sp.]